MYKNIFYFIPLFVFFSCDSLIEKIPIEKDQFETIDDKAFVVSAYISPETTETVVTLTEYQSILEQPVNTNNSRVANATVILRDSERSVSLSYSNGVYSISSADFPIRYEETYHLTIEHNGKKSEGSCTVPPKVKVEQLSWDNQRFSMVWKGKEAKENAYIVGVYEEGSSTNPVDEFSLKGDRYFTKNDEVNLRYRSIYTPFTDVFYAYTPKGTYNFRLLSMDEHLHKSYISQENEDIDEGPFQEIVITYSNMNGDGTGVFGAYSRAEKSITVNENSL